jgi:hypothetical protein
LLQALKQDWFHTFTDAADMLVLLQVRLLLLLGAGKVAEQRPAQVQPARLLLELLLVLLMLLRQLLLLQLAVAGPIRSHPPACCRWWLCLAWIAAVVALHLLPCPCSYCWCCR